MSSVDLFREARGADVRQAIRPSRLIKMLRKTMRSLHAAIAAAKLRRLRNELLFRRGAGAAAAIELDARRRPQAPLILGDKWDF